jgi:cytidyltransferase-like protein
MERKYHIETLDIVSPFLLFPLDVVKSFLKIVHLLYSETRFFPLLTRLDDMSFTLSSQMEAKNIHISPISSLQDEIFDVAMCFGTFDLFHPGHRYYIETALKLAKKLIIVIARDTRVIEKKKIFPTHSEKERQKILQTAYPEALVILGDESDIFVPIRSYEPDILVFGYDQYIPAETIKELFPDITLTKVDGFEIEKWKSSILRKK